MKKRFGFDLLDLVELIMATVPFMRGISQPEMASALREAVNAEDEDLRSELLRYLEFHEMPRRILLVGLDEVIGAMYAAGMLGSTFGRDWLRTEERRGSVVKSVPSQGELMRRLATRAAQILTEGQ